MTTMTFAEVELHALTRCGTCNETIHGTPKVMISETLLGASLIHRFDTWACYVKFRDTVACEMCGYWFPIAERSVDYPVGFHVCSRCDIASVMRQYGNE